MARVRRDRHILSDLLQAIASHPASPGGFLGIIHFLSQVTGLTERYSFDICNHKVSGRKKKKRGGLAAPDCLSLPCIFILSSLSESQCLKTSADRLGPAFCKASYSFILAAQRKSELCCFRSECFANFELYFIIMMAFLASLDL